MRHYLNGNLSLRLNIENRLISKHTLSPYEVTHESGWCKLKIALVVPHFFWAFGGHEYYLARELTKLNNQVKVFTSNILPTRYFKEIKKTKPIKKSVNELFEVEWLNTPLEIHGIPLFDPAGALQDYKPDIIHVQEFFQFCSQKAFLNANRMKVPFIFTQHKYDHPKGLWKVVWKSWGKLSGEYICKHSSHITAISRAAKIFIIQSMSAPERRVSVIPLGVDPEEFRPLDEEGTRVKEKLGLKGKIAILFVGRLTPVKGVDYLVKAFLRIHRKFPKTCLLIRGDGDLKSCLQDFIRNHGLENFVIFLPFYVRRELPLLYAMSDIFVLPSLKEPFGLVLLEAMACGKPVIGTKIGGISDIIKDKENGFLISQSNIEELVEKLEILVRDEKLRINMGLNGRKMAEKEFDYEVIAKKTLKIYEKCVEKEL